MKQRKYAIVDLETTGGMAKRDKIVEIGIVISDGQRVLETFETLVNPERSIPMDVIRIHGITDEMVQDAPKFFEIAKKVIELTEDCIFVAHNVLFDYGFVRSEFEALGFTYTRPTLCTVRLSRKAFPGLPSYGLSNLSRHFAIHISNRHRALDDAMATGIIFHKILEVVTLDTHLGISMKSQIKEARYPEGISEETIQKLPTTVGVYYFYNEYERVIYVGKSINIQARVKQHFSDFTPKYEKLFQRVKMIDYVETGTEILALLLEDYEIKALGPEINKAQRNKAEKYFSHYFTDDDGYIQIGVLPIQKSQKYSAQILNFYSNIRNAKSSLLRYVNMYQLCESKISVYQQQTYCLGYATALCHGACHGLESPEEYNFRARQAITEMGRLFDRDFLVTIPGRTPDEEAILLVQDGFYRGFCFVNHQEQVTDPQEIVAQIKTLHRSMDANIILQNFLMSNQRFRIIELKKEHFLT